MPQQHLYLSRATRISTPLVCVGCLVGAAQATIIIDDFSITEEGGPWTEHLTTNAEESTRVESFNPFASGVLGGRRTTVITAEEIGVENFDFVRGVLAPSVGIFDYASTANARGKLSFFYDGVEQNFSADLSGKSQIHIAFTEFDFANGEVLPVTVTLSDGQATVSHSLSLGENELDLFFSLGEFGGIDLSSIESILVEFDPTIGADFRLGHMSAIPAPGILAVMGLGGIALGRRRRRSMNN